ncbi:MULTISPECIES: TrbG/VirB9 family P-type conjugative transfer protein [unclassified Luteimonas]|uniref:TrbG/VirB9 family P-type conjugative transfer protein n=1 Tax=unclassified Luteimonas TaxID=2629088 RepID=UPI0018F0C417|nr:MULTISPECIES: TrbG/VirB9 family P-type conjugative transfer protein [unclassified Luteimonas]MBJ6979647.1 TrbG/VirB9 family P-type conjugative transfer protein [Luteimonas sp. MC1895]MBJ6983068.1 TrbG/VirB9 family P-type conjugative transfer protein [Luteimonas sp. MC1750]QQO05219.1 TrbG/VirB9 family P-type conjugative transfer protein [Luteimonas sp. MC1750]
MKSFLAGLVLCAGLLSPPAATAQQGAAPPQVDTFDYVPGGIYPVRTALGITTQIELDPAEEILDFSTGFSSGWDLTRRGNVFYLRPRDGDVDTNMLVRTRAHAYIFELKVVAADWTSLDQVRRAGVQYRVGFRYPADAAFGPAEEAAAPVEPGQSTALSPDRLYNFDYDVAARRAPPWLVPMHVYDDGRFTYLRMSRQVALPTGTFPAVFGRSSRDGDEFVVNTTVEGDVLIVHGTWPFLVVRHGDDVVGIRRTAR